MPPSTVHRRTSAFTRFEGSSNYRLSDYSLMKKTGKQGTKDRTVPRAKGPICLCGHRESEHAAGSYWDSACRVCICSRFRERDQWFANRGVKPFRLPEHDQGESDER